MSELIEGEWKSFTFKMIRSEEDIQKGLDILNKYFFPEETLTILSCQNPEYIPMAGVICEPLLRKAFEENLSFYVEHTETKKVAAVRVIRLHKKGHPEPESIPEPGTEEKEPHIVIMQMMKDFLDHVASTVDIYSMFPDIDQYAELLMTATAPEFRRQGLATEMYKRAFELLKSKDIKVCETTISSPYTLKAVRNLKFDEHEKVFYKQYKDKEGNFPYLHAKEETFVVLVTKRLK